MLGVWIWEPCKCGSGELELLESINWGKEIEVIFFCNNCKKVYSDNYSLEYSGRKKIKS